MPVMKKTVTGERVASVEIGGPARARAGRWLACGALAVGFLVAGSASSAAAQEMSCGLEAIRFSEVRRIPRAQMQGMFALGPVAAEGAFDIQIVPGPGLQANPAALAALERAAAHWEAVIRDPITVRIDADFGPVEPGQLAFTDPLPLGLELADFVEGLAIDGDDEAADVVAQRARELAGGLPVVFPPGFSFDGIVVFTKANAKALVEGEVDLDEMFGVSDATIVFGPGVPFDFDNRNGVTAGQFDFETAAAHEIGHALGFLSIVDGVEASDGPQPVPVLTLDLFRFPFSPAGLPDAAGFNVSARSVQPGVEAMFDDIDHELRFSTGTFLGDGRQASHWKADELTGITIGVMDPTLSRGAVVPISAADRRALDVIGFEIAAAEAVPSVTVLADGVVAGASIVVPANQTIQLNSQSSDGDGLGFPALLPFGSTLLVSQLWNFGGLQPVNGPLAGFSDSPQIRFDLPAGGPSRTFPISVTAFDTLGDTATRAVNVIASEPPIVAIRANGDIIAGLGPVGGALFDARFRAGQPVQLQAVAQDTDGLGFPLFASLGISTPIMYLWDFGGGQSSNPFAIFDRTPLVTFQLEPGQSSREFTVSLTVLDTLGLRTTRTATVTIERSGPPAVNLVVNGLVLGSTPGEVVTFGPVRFGAMAFDEDGLGFPIFAGLGSTSAVSFLWNFGGGQTASPLEIFSSSPVVQFPVDPQMQRIFTVSLTVFDATGASTTRSVNITPMATMTPASAP
jgi:hypothetical protein